MATLVFTELIKNKLPWNNLQYGPWSDLPIDQNIKWFEMQGLLTVSESFAYLHKWVNNLAFWSNLVEE